MCWEWLGILLTAILKICDMMKLNMMETGNFDFELQTMMSSNAIVLYLGFWNK